MLKTNFQNPFEVLDARFDEIKSLIIGLNFKPILVPTSHEPERLLTKKELAKFLGISEVSVWSRMKDGSIKSYKIGNLVRFKQSEILSNLHQIQRKK